VDPLSDIFKTLQIAGGVNCRLEATAPWGIMNNMRDGRSPAPFFNRRDFSHYELAHLGMIVRGECWLSVDGRTDSLLLGAGDCFFIAPGSTYVLRDSLRTRPRSLSAIAPADGTNVVRYGGGGAPTTIIAGHFSFERVSVRHFTQLMPSLVLIKAHEIYSASLRTCLQLLDAEMTEQAPGSEIVANRLAEVLFVQIIRTHISAGHANGKIGWLRAIFDPRIGKALGAIHESVDKPWTLDSLATTAGMSRSAFASHFKRLVGQTPLEFITDWRMQKAVQLLQQGDKKLLDVARSVGYDSDAAFSKAFKRLVGLTPGEYRKNSVQKKRGTTAEALWESKPTSP
jgi:AraC-like DNA-binding protein